MYSDLHESSTVVKYKQYVDLGKHTKDLMAREMSIPTFITELIEVIKEYVPQLELYE